MAALKHDASSKAFKPVIDLINRCLEQDQGNAYRYELEQIILAQSDIYQQKDIQFRSHMGASLLGKKCKRDVWYSFRWVQEPWFEGRMIRLFNRGHMEEMRLIALLRQAKLDAWFTNSDGSQFAFSNCNGHYGGSLDCVVRGVPQFETIPMLAEFKTHSDKSYSKLVNLGVKLAKPEHFTQMNQYMGHYKLTKALYIAVNKNNDELYAEIVDFDEAEFNFDVTLANTISSTVKPPIRISKDPNFFQCKYCDFVDICHKNKKPEKNCRTCINSVMLPEGKWACGIQNNLDLSKEMQYNGCHQHAYLEDL